MALGYYKLSARNRPKSENKKLLLSIRYSSEVLAYFKSTGEGWRSLMGSKEGVDKMRNAMNLDPDFFWRRGNRGHQHRDRLAD
ncbi:MAG: BrnA antitoxin family protein [Pseudomonadota bacterium]